MLECIWNRLHSRSFTIFFSTFIVATPVVVISYSFIRIFSYVYASRRRVAALSKMTESPVGDKTNGTNTTGKNGNATITSRSQRSSVHLAMTLFISFAVFVICWTPYALIVVIDMGDKQPLSVYLYILLLAHLHASLNSIVYGVTNRLFRQAYINIFTELCCFCTTCGLKTINTKSVESGEMTYVKTIKVKAVSSI